MTAWISQVPGMRTSTSYLRTPKQPTFNGCFSWMTPNLYIKDDSLTKHPLEN